MKEKVKKIIAVVLTFLMSIGCVQSYPMVSALESDYEVYPNPHMMEYQDGSFDITSNVNIVYEDGIDEYTRDRLNEVLAIKKINATTSTEVKEDQTNILVGIKGSNQYVDQYAGEHYTVKTSDLFDQLDSYLLKVDNGKITVLGKDTDAAFYGLTSLYHIFKQLDGTNIRNFTMEDYANVASRGFIEGYYGNPWSTTDRIKLMEWGGYYKLILISMLLKMIQNIILNGENFIQTKKLKQKSNLLQKQEINQNAVLSSLYILICMIQSDIIVKKTIKMI